MCGGEDHFCPHGLAPTESPLSTVSRAPVGLFGLEPLVRQGPFCYYLGLFVIWGNAFIYLFILQKSTLIVHQFGATFSVLFFFPVSKDAVLVSLTPLSDTVIIEIVLSQLWVFSG